MIRLPFFKTPIKKPSAVYQFLINQKAVSVAELIDQPERILDYYLKLDDLSCCSILGGYVISANSKVVMHAVDEVSMSESWLPAIINLQKGATSESVWAWEESNMTLTRKESLLEMKDVHHSGKVVCPKTRFLFIDFVAAMLEASRPMAHFVEKFHSAMARLEPKLQGDAEALERIELLRDQVSADWIKNVRECESLLRLSETPKEI